MEKTKVLITVRGGTIQSIQSNSSEVEIFVADYDEINEGFYGDLVKRFDITDGDAVGAITDAQFTYLLQQLQREQDEHDNQKSFDI